MTTRQKRDLIRSSLRMALVLLGLAGLFIILRSAGVLTEDTITVTFNWKQALGGVVLIDLAILSYRYLFINNKPTKKEVFKK